jgi:DegV family protein with EDD domain
MSRVCILTDSTAQFLQPSFPGQEIVSILPFQIRIASKLFANGYDLKVSQLPESLADDEDFHLIPPGIGDFQAVYSSLSRKYDDIIVILVSSHLSGAYALAQQAIESFHGPASITLIDSQTAGVGLGLIVQAAAAAALNGKTAAEIHRLALGLMPHTYAAFCTQSLSYLSRAGYIDPAQAIVGELIGLTPFFTLENGRLAPVQKVRNSRHMVDLMHEYISEFSNLKHIALVQGNPPFEQEARNLKERFSLDFPQVTFSEHLLNASLATMFGPRSLGIVVMENGFIH